VALLKKHDRPRFTTTPRTMARRLRAMEAWLADPQLMAAMPDAEYAESDRDQPR